MAYIGTPPNEDITVNTKEYIATAGQTEFIAVYQDYVEVLLNGVQLAKDDYTATDGMKVVLVQGAQAGDVVVVRGFSKYQYTVNTLVHYEQGTEPNVTGVTPGDTWWDTVNSVLYKCVTASGAKTWLQIA